MKSATGRHRKSKKRLVPSVPRGDGVVNVKGDLYTNRSVWRRFFVGVVRWFDDKVEEISVFGFRVKFRERRADKDISR